SREENLKHTAVFRLALGRTIPSLQASWVKMGLDLATEALRWGVNDLGGTLMEESKSRMALSDPQRAALAEAMVADVLDALAEVTALDGILVVTREPRAVAAAQA